MRFAKLYLRSRRVGWALLTLLSASSVVWMLTWLLVSGTPYGVARGGLTMILVFGALVAACVVGASADSPFGDAERASARSLASFRLAHLSGLLFSSALLLSTALLTFELDGARPEYPLLVLLRNILVLTGLALIAARAVGARVSWFVPFTAAIACTTLMGSGGDIFSAWTTNSYHGLHRLSWVTAVVLISAGLTVVCFYGARETAGEGE